MRARLRSQARSRPGISRSNRFIAYPYKATAIKYYLIHYMFLVGQTTSASDVRIAPVVVDSAWNDILPLTTTRSLNQYIWLWLVFLSY